MLDPKYIPLFLGGFVLWMIIIVAVGFFGRRGKRDGQKFLTVDKGILKKLRKLGQMRIANPVDFVMEDDL